MLPVDFGSRSHQYAPYQRERFWRHAQMPKITMLVMVPTTPMMMSIKLPCVVPSSRNPAHFCHGMTGGSHVVIGGIAITSFENSWKTDSRCESSFHKYYRAPLGASGVAVRSRSGVSRNLLFLLTVERLGRG